MSTEDKNGFFSKFKATLNHTRTKLGDGIAELVLRQKGISDEFLEDVETQMLTADIGIEATTEIIENLRKKMKRKDLVDPSKFMLHLKSEMIGILKPCEQKLEVTENTKPFVILVVGANGDYTVKSSEDLYTNNDMLSKLVCAYEERCVNKKTLIFNNGINTSLIVYDTFKSAGFQIKHLDNTATKKERANILKWFKETPNAILTSVSILTTGFDEPTVESIIINRATKSLTLYYQMIGRGSRVLETKSNFDVIDLGNNFYRFGEWASDINWQQIFKFPDNYLDSIVSDEEIEGRFRYEMPEEILELFSNSENLYFNVNEVYVDSIRNGKSSKIVLQKAIEHHSKICVENSGDVYDALNLVKELSDDIDYLIKRYSKCISKSTPNFLEWLAGDYKKRLRSYIRINFDHVKGLVH